MPLFLEGQLGLAANVEMGEGFRVGREADIRSLSLTLSIALSQCNSPYFMRLIKLLPLPAQKVDNCEQYNSQDNGNDEPNFVSMGLGRSMAG